MKRTACLMCLALLVASTTSTFAQVQTFLGDNNGSPRNLTVPNAAQTAFLAQIPVHGTDTYDTYPIDPTFFFGFTPSTLTLSGISTTYTTNAPVIGSDIGSTAQTGFALSVSPSQFLSSTDVTNHVIQNVTFTFSNIVNAFGVFMVDVGDVTNSTQLTITLQNGAAGAPRTYPINSSGNGTGTPTTFAGRQIDATFYFGILDFNPFDRVTINSNNPNDGFVFDTLSAAAVPEPATYALIGCLGAFGYAGVRYQRRKAAKRLQAKVV